jgi:hypothetical protein
LFQLGKLEDPGHINRIEEEGKELEDRSFQDYNMEDFFDEYA